MKRRNIFYTILIILNIVCLYFIIDLFNYDEIVEYLLNGEKRITHPRKLTYLLYITILSNLYFIAFTIMERAFGEKD